MTAGPTQLTLAFEHRPALGAEDFIVTPANATAVGGEPSLAISEVPLDREDLERLARRHPAIMARIREVAATRRRVNRGEVD